MIKTTLKIDGMMCSHCEAHMNDTIRNTFDVKKVTSSHKNSETVIISDESLDKEKIEEAVKSCGYVLNGISEEEYKKSGLFSFGK